MQVTVLHNIAEDETGRPLGMLDGYQPGHVVVTVAQYTENDTLSGMDAPDRAWFLFNVGDNPERSMPEPIAVEYRARGNRSLSVGDVVRLVAANGTVTYYAVGHAGWRNIERPKVTDGVTYGTTPVAALRCDECDEVIPDAETSEVNASHGPSCSLYPGNTVTP